MKDTKWYRVEGREFSVEFWIPRLVHYQDQLGGVSHPVDLGAEFDGVGASCGNVDDRIFDEGGLSQSEIPIVILREWVQGNERDVGGYAAALIAEVSKG